MERNVVFNQNDILEKENTTVTVGVQSEGENKKDKVIQHPENDNEVKNQIENDDKPQNKDEEPQSKQVEPTTPTKTTNLVVFPSSPEPEIEAESGLE